MPRSPLTFREKSLSAQFAAILLVYGYFGARYWGQPLIGLQAVTVVIGIGVLMTVLLVPTLIVMAKRHRPERLDERDRLIELCGSRNAYTIFAIVVWGVLLLAIGNTSPGRLFPLLMGAFALAELVRLGSQLLYYRRGV